MPKRCLSSAEKKGIVLIKETVQRFRSDPSSLADSFFNLEIVSAYANLKELSALGADSGFVSVGFEFR